MLLRNKQITSMLKEISNVANTFYLVILLQNKFKHDAIARTGITETNVENDILN